MVFRIDAGRGQKHNGCVQNPMSSQIYKQQSLMIVYDADAIPQPDRQLFDPGYWQKQGQISGQAPGRGSALMLETEFGSAVLKRYLRGGWAAAVSRDRYLFTGFERSRPLREFRILQSLMEMKLPVPEPLAALCERSGMSFTGALITRRIQPALPLAERLGDMLEARLPDCGAWSDIGACIRRFHDRGVIHADLNARNILLHDDGSIFLIDFDRARIRPGADLACLSNLKRFQRSLHKVWPSEHRHRLENCWQYVLTGYDEAVAPPSRPGVPPGRLM